MRSAVVALPAGALVAFAVTAGAAPPAELGVSEYHAALGCPGEFTFRAQVQARTERLQLVPAEQAGAPDNAPRFVVWLRQAGGAYAGTLEIWRQHVATKTELEAPTCDEVVAGLSIAAALSAEAGAGPPAVTPEPVPRPLPARAAPEPAPVTKDLRPVSREESAWLLALQPGMRFGAIPGSSPTLGVSFGRWLSSGSPGLTWRLELAAALGNQVSGAGSRPLKLDFSWWGASGDVCPVRLSASPNAQFLGCASVELGMLRVIATSDEASTRPWVAPGIALRFAARFGALFLEPRLAGRAPIIRDQYWFRPDTRAFRASPVTAEASLAGGFAF